MCKSRGREGSDLHRQTVEQWASFIVSVGGLLCAQPTPGEGSFVGPSCSWIADLPPLFSGLAQREHFSIQALVALKLSLTSEYR